LTETPYQKKTTQKKTSRKNHQGATNRELLKAMTKLETACDPIEAPYGPLVGIPTQKKLRVK